MKTKYIASILIVQFLLCQLVFAQQRGAGVTVKDANNQNRQLYEGSYALIIGNSEYTNGWGRLSGVETDVVAVRGILERHGFKVETEENLTSERFEPRIRKFINDYGYDRNNRLIIYYAGHGYTLNSTGDARELGYVVPADAPLPDTDPRGFRQKAVDMYAMQRFARQIQAKHALFVFDSCFSGKLFALRDGLKITPFIYDKVDKPVRQFITAGNETQAVPDESIFRKAFVRGLEGDADRNNDGYITGTELADYLKEAVTNYSNRRQTPQYGLINDIDLDRGDFVFVKPDKYIPTPAEIAWNNFRGLAKRLMKYDYVSSFSEGLAEVCVGKYPNSKCGFIDILGNETIPLKYNSTQSFTNGLAEVELNNLYGFIDKTGKEVVPVKYSWIRYEPKDGELIQFKREFQNGGSYYGYVNKIGQEVIPAKYENLQSLSEDRFGAYRNGKHGFLDKSGNEIIPFIYDNAGLFSEGLAAVKLNGKYGFINNTGQTILPFIYDDAYFFTKGLAAVAQNGKWGLINKKGQLIVPYSYDELGFYGLEEDDVNRREFGGYYFAINNKKIGLIDHRGNQVLPIKYDIPIGARGEGLIAVNINGKWGFVNLKGETAIPFKFDEAHRFENGLAHVKLNGKEGMIDKAGKVVIPFEFDAIYAPSEGKFPVQVNDKYGLIDFKGKQIISPRYDNFWCYALEKEGFIGVMLNGKKGFVDIYGSEYFEL